MKKLFLIIVITVTSVSVWAQSQLTTISGKTKDQKTIEVKYYKGAVGDYVESVKYQVVDELQAQVKKLQSDVKNMQGKLDAANNTIRELKNQPENTADSEELMLLRKQIAEAETRIEALNDSIVGLQAQISSTSKQSGTELKALQNEISLKDQSILQLYRQIETYRTGVAAPVIGLEAGLGLVFPTRVEDNWKINLNKCLQAAVYFGTARLSESFPVSIEAGVGVRKISMSAYLNSFETTNSTTDVDNDPCEVTHLFTNLSERLALTYLDIPVRLCFGQPYKSKASLYAKLGVTPSINMGADFEGKGTYHVKGFYPQWGVTLENITELGYGDGESYPDNVEAEINSFNLWGNLSVGGYIPLSENIPVVVNLGVKLNYPILSIGTIPVEGEGISLNLPNDHTGLLQNGGKVVIPSVQVGLIYILK